MLKRHEEGELPPVGQRPVWCDSNDAADWWLPVHVYVILRVLVEEADPLGSVSVASRCRVALPVTLLTLHVLEELGLVRSCDEDEFDPVGWSAYHEEGCLCTPRRLFTATGRGHLWFSAVPPQAEPRSQWWTSKLFWLMLLLGASVWWLAVLIW